MLYVLYALGCQLLFNGATMYSALASSGSWSLPSLPWATEPAAADVTPKRRRFRKRAGKV